MNVTELRLCSPGSEGGYITHVTFMISKPNRNQPYILKNATGFDANEIIKTFNDGPQFFRVRPKQRVISLLIKPNPDYNAGVTIGDLRDSLYRAIAFNTNGTVWNSDSKLEFRFMNGNNYVASVFGFVSKFEANIFTNEPDIQMTIECDDPFLRSIDLIHMDEAIDITPNGAFHTYNTVNYPIGSSFNHNDTVSTAPHGFKMIINVVSVPTQDPPRLIVWDNRNPSQYIFSASFDFHVGDVIHFSSEEDDRFLFVERNDIGYSMMNNIYWGSIWPFIWPGANHIDVSEGMHVASSEHRASYWGV